MSNSALKSKGDGMVTRQAAETVLIAEGLFDNKVRYEAVVLNAGVTTLRCRSITVPVAVSVASLSLSLLPSLPVPAAVCCHYCHHRCASLSLSRPLQEFPMSAMLDHLEAAALKRLPAGGDARGLIYADDLVAFVSNDDPALDGLQFGRPVAPMVRPRLTSPAAERRRGGADGVTRIRVPRVLQRAGIGAAKGGDTPTPRSDL
jgi:hypothetical protein